MTTEEIKVYLKKKKTNILRSRAMKEHYHGHGKLFKQAALAGGLYGK